MLGLSRFLSGNISHVNFKQNSTPTMQKYSEKFLTNFRAKDWVKLPVRPHGLSQIFVFKLFIFKGKILVTA